MNAARNTILVLAIFGLAYFGVTSFFSYRMGERSKETWAAMMSEDMPCSPGTELRTEPWGFQGYTRTCVSLKDGKWEAWADGYRHIEGGFKNGKEHGIWAFYRADGSVSKTIEYRDGQEISRSETDDNAGDT